MNSLMHNPSITPRGGAGKKERKGKKQQSCFSELWEFLLLLHLWTLYKAMSTVGFLQPMFEWELAWHLGLYFWRNFKASDFQFLITRVFIFSQSIIIHGSTLIFYGSKAKWESGWISNLILHLSRLSGSYLLQTLKASVLTSPHRVGKMNTWPLSRTRHSQSKEQREQQKLMREETTPPRQVQSILSPLLRPWSCLWLQVPWREVGCADVIFNVLSWERKTSQCSSLLPCQGMNKSLLFTEV